MVISTGVNKVFDAVFPDWKDSKKIDPNVYKAFGIIRRVNSLKFSEPGTEMITDFKMTLDNINEYIINIPD